MMAKRSTRRKAKAVPDFYARPTIERMAHNDVEPAGAAVRMVAVIDTMLATHQLTRAEYDKLAYYRQQAHRAEDDCAVAGTLAPEKIMGGGGQRNGSHIPASLICTPAIIETARIERDLDREGFLLLARAVAVHDISLTRWCIQQHGGRERYGPKGKFIAVVPIREKDVVPIARQQLRYATGLITT